MGSGSKPAPLAAVVLGAALAFAGGGGAAGQDELFIGEEPPAETPDPGMADATATAADAPDEEPAPAPDAPAVQTARGVLEPADEAILSSQLTALIEAMPLDAGDRFAAGDVLVAFDCAQYEAQRAQAQAMLQGAQAKLSNQYALQRLNAGSQLEAQLASAESAQASAAVQEAEVAIARCTLAAPYDGRVVERMANAHEVAEPGTQLMSIVSDGPLHVTLLVPSPWLAWLAEGQDFAFEVDETGGTHPATVTTIGARVDPVSQRIIVRGTFAEAPPDLLPGMSGSAHFTRAPD
jgi:RND family efflux transporter MFP subunit